MPDRIAIVTGASRGIGYALSLELCRRGHRVLALSRSAEGLNRLKTEANSDLLESVVIDITDRDALSKLVSDWKRSALKIDILINNAGYLVNKPFAELTDSEIHRMYDVNVMSVFTLIRESMVFFSDDVHVVNISSMGGVQGAQKFPGLSAYSSSKMALTGMTECLQEELGDRGWSFNCLCLGSVQTEMLTQAFPGFKAPINPAGMAIFIADFAEKGKDFFKGKVLPVSRTTP